MMRPIRPPSTRIAPLLDIELGSSARELLATVSDQGAVPNIFLTLVRAEGLLRKWLPFGGKLLNGRIPVRARELLILRTGWNCAAEYEWMQHVVIARSLGIMQTEIDRVACRSTAGWSVLDGALMHAADELHFDSCIADDTWAVLAEHYDQQQLIELTMLVGQYTLIAMTLNSLGVPLDDDLELSNRILNGGSPDADGSSDVVRGEPR